MSKPRISIGHSFGQKESEVRLLQAPHPGTPGAWTFRGFGAETHARIRIAGAYPAGASSVGRDGPRRWRLKPGTPDDGQCRIAREPAVRARSLAQQERGAAAVGDGPRVEACRTKAG